MSSRHLVDPELIPFLEAFPTSHITAENLAAIRQARNAALAQLPPLPASVRVEEVFIPGPAGAPDVRVKLYRRKDGAEGPRPAILHLHGGAISWAIPNSWARCARSGQTLMTPSSWRPLTGSARRPAILAMWKTPTQPSPGPMPWPLTCASTRRASPWPVKSAGGGLAAALALLARDRGAYRFCHQQLIFPMIDDRTAVRADLSPMFGEFVWTNTSNHFGWASLLGEPPGGRTSRPMRRRPARQALPVCRPLSSQRARLISLRRKIWNMPAA